MYTVFIDEMVKKISSNHGGLLSRQELTDILVEYWQDYAVHIWSIPDIFDVANRNAIPTSIEMARESLRNMESYVDSEYGMTWDSVELAVEKWHSDVSFDEMSDEKLAEYKGRFAFKYIDGEEERTLFRDIVGGVFSDGLLSAKRAAQVVANTRMIDIDIYSVDEESSSIIADDFSGHTKFCLTIEPEKVPCIDFHYMYRDGANWKNHGSISFANPTGEDSDFLYEKFLALLEDGYFVAEQVSLLTLFNDNYDANYDHGFHEIHHLKELVTKPEDDREILEFLAEFEEASKSGWTPVRTGE